MIILVVEYQKREPFVACRDASRATELVQLVANVPYRVTIYVHAPGFAIMIASRNPQTGKWRIFNRHDLEDWGVLLELRPEEIEL